MKKRLVCCFVILCMVLSGCAGKQGEAQKPLEQEDARQEAGASAAPSQAEEPEPSAEPEPTPEEDAFSGRWQAVESPQCYMDIARGDGDGYTLEIVWSGASRGDIIWQAVGSYDEIWGGVAYTGAKYEDVVKEDGTIDRIPVPEREAVTGMVYLEDDGTLRWIDDFDHMGDDMRFEKE